MNSITKIIFSGLTILTLSGCAHYNGRYDNYPDNGYSSGYGSYGSYGNYGYPVYGGGGGGYYGGNRNYPDYRHHHHHPDRDRDHAASRSQEAGPCDGRTARRQ